MLQDRKSAELSQSPATNATIITESVSQRHLLFYLAFNLLVNKRSRRIVYVRVVWLVQHQLLGTCVYS